MNNIYYQFQHSGRASKNAKLHARQRALSQPRIQRFKNLKYCQKWSRIISRCSPDGSSTSTDKTESKSAQAGFLPQSSSAEPSLEDDAQLLNTDSKFELFDLKPFNIGWDVPWNGVVTAQGMFGFYVTYFGASLILPLYFLQGHSPQEVIPRDMTSLFVLVEQALLTICGVGVLRITLGDEYIQYADDEVWSLSFRQPYGPNGWVTWASYGLAASVVCVLTLTVLQDTTHFLDPFIGKGFKTVDGLTEIMQPSLYSYLETVITTSLLGPVLEEYVFRGFLLTSLTKYMPVWQAVVWSSLAFGVSHLAIGDLLQLTVVGMLIGMTFVRTKNLLTPIAMHSMWNFGSTTVVFYLMKYGGGIGG